MNYSDWEIVDNESGIPVNNQDKSSSLLQSPVKNKDDWETVSLEPNSMQPQPKESTKISVLKALPRILEDTYRKTYKTIQNVPEYYNNAVNAPKEIYNAFKNDPKSTAKQGLAGIAEMGQGIFNLPHDMANYASERLNLISPEINRKIQMARMPDDTGSIIDNALGVPKSAGEKDVRWLGRNVDNILATGGLASALNPLKLTEKGITKNVLKEGDRQVATHSKLYNDLWNDSKSAGINNVPVNPQIISDNLDFIKKYKSSRDYKTIESFLQDNSLPNAQKAVSDVRSMRRGLEEKSRTTSLTGEEKKLLDSLDEVESHIENNMFKDSSGVKNSRLAGRYRDITNSYRENVVPYRYNPDIQAYKNKEITRSQLVNRLGSGEFSAKKGSKHKAIGVRKKILPTAQAVGLFGAGKYLYDNMFGNSGFDEK